MIQQYADPQTRLFAAGVMRGASIHDVIPLSMWLEILGDVGEHKSWEGEIRAIAVKLVQVGDSLARGSRVRYSVRVKMTWISQTVETAFEALTECARLIREAHGL